MIKLIQDHICDFRAYNVPEFMIKDGKQTIRSKGFCWMNLVKSLDDFIFGEGPSQLCVHVLNDTPRNYVCDFSDSSKGGGGIDFLKVIHLFD